MRQPTREESNDDEFILGLLLDLEREDEVRSIVASSSHPGKRANVERHHGDAFKDKYRLFCRVPCL